MPLLKYENWQAVEVAAADDERKASRMYQGG